MIIVLLLALPAAAGGVAFLLRGAPLRRALLLGTAVLHTALTAAAWWQRPAPVFEGWLALDDAGLLFLGITSALFLAAAVYAVGHLQHEATRHLTDFEEGFLFDNAPEAVFIGCLLLFLAAMTLVTVSQHFGLLWIAVEATTLASAPLIYFHRHRRSLEATWKYLLVCSVGIALALLANFFLGVAAARPDATPTPLVLDELVRHSADLQPSWLKAALILFLVGYGTKMGLAPLHTWLPDAHSEAPSVVSALLSGALLNCAFLGIVRAQQVCVAAGLAAFGQDMLIALGLFSMAVAAIFIIGQTDYKRLLAYSSVEHVGILALGVGLGGAGAFGAMLHAVNHSLTKAMLFFLAGNILALYQTKTASQVRGLLRVAPLTGMLWLAGFLAITGTPPFGPFLSEFTILKAAFDEGHAWVGAVYLALLAVIFIGLATVFLAMAQGPGEKPPAAATRTITLWENAPPLVLAALVLMLGVFVPARLSSLLHAIAQTLGGS
jgi:hydrogenase-4 component F